MLLVGLCSAIARADSIPGPVSRFALLPDVVFEADLRRFFLQRTDYARTHYYIESFIYIEPQWVSYRDVWFLATAFDVSPGMGHTPKNVVFDPMDINFAFTPFLEYRTPRLAARAGLDHRCFHEIDRKDYSTVYWNMLFAAVGSPQTRLDDMARSSKKDGPWYAYHRFSWSVQAGWFMRRFFDLVRESSVNYRNNNVFETAAEGRYAFYSAGDWVMSAAGKSALGWWADSTADPENRAYWRQKLSLEASYAPGDFGMMLFVSYFLDDVARFPMKNDPLTLEPRFSRNGILELGVRVFR